MTLTPGLLLAVLVISVVITVIVMELIKWRNRIINTRRHRDWINKRVGYKAWK